MDEESRGRNGIARNFEMMVLRRVAQETQVKLAERLGYSTTQISRIMSGTAGMPLADIGAMLEALGLDVVYTGDEGTVTIPADEYTALRTLAVKGLSA